MILVRPYEDSDQSAISALHAQQGLDYQAPDWNKVLVSALVEVDGKVEMAAFLRKTAECYLLVSPEVKKKRERLGQLLMLHKELLEPAQRVGFEDVHCWVPPQLDLQFGKLLLHLGWSRPLWPCYSREVK